MRSFLSWIAPLLVLGMLAGCGESGVETGVPKVVPTGPPPVPPGTSKEMLNKSPQKAYRPPG